MNSQNNSLILSICIPTYNRPKEFERMLLGLLPQLTHETEIVVRDDSPNSESKEVFDRLFSGKGINHQYYRGEKIGLDAASIFLLEHAKGRFFWLFSDDDELLDGGIAEVIRLVKSNTDLNLIWANFSSESADNLAVKNRQSGFFRDGSEALEVVGTGIGLVSTQIFRCDRGLLGLDIARKHVVGFSFASTAIYLSVLAGPGRFYFMKGPYVMCHPTKVDEIKVATTKTGTIINEGFNVYGIHFFSIIKEFEGKFNKRAIKKILSVNFAALWRGMLVGWVGGWDTPVGKRWMMFRYYWNFPEFWLAIPFFLMPLWINKLLYRIYKIFFSNRKFRFLVR